VKQDTSHRRGKVITYLEHIDGSFELIPDINIKGGVDGDRIKSIMEGGEKEMVDIQSKVAEALQAGDLAKADALYKEMRGAAKLVKVAEAKVEAEKQAKQTAKAREKLEVELRTDLANLLATTSQDLGQLNAKAVITVDVDGINVAVKAKGTSGGGGGGTGGTGNRGDFQGTGMSMADFVTMHGDDDFKAGYADMDNSIRWQKARALAKKLKLGVFVEA